MKISLLYLTIYIVIFSSACSKVDIIDEISEVLHPTPPVDTLDRDSVNFKIGINGHPVTQEAYKELAPSEQIKLIKGLGMSIYRVDVAINSKTGFITMHDRYLDLKRSADSLGVMILPMLYNAPFDFSVTEETSYKSGYDRGNKFANLYKEDFIYYNLANELDNKCILPNKSGTLASHYDLAKFKIIAAHLKGMNDGVKAADVNAQTMVNAGWLHYKYLLMLEEYGVNFDIVAYHWYDDMERLAAKNYNIQDITKVLSEKFTKPIWFTEFNVRHPDKQTEVSHLDYLNTFITKCKNNPQVKAALIYELFEQPVFNSRESTYGIYRWITPYKTYHAKFNANTIAQN